MDAAARPLDLDELGRDLARVADRLRSMSDVRLTQHDGRDGTRAAAALDLAQQLADAALGVDARGDRTPPPRRVVPDLGVFALGDQVSVTGHDLVDALGQVSAGDRVWGPAGPVTAVELLEQVAAAVRDLRLRL